MTARDHHPRPILIEAVCGTCGETFNPLDEDDLEHIQRDDETPCGGTGTIRGSVYSTRNPPHER